MIITYNLKTDQKSDLFGLQIVDGINSKKQKKLSCLEATYTHLQHYWLSSLHHLAVEVVYSPHV